MIERDHNTLSPGIRKTVEWLHCHGFKICDSGDGVSKKHPVSFNPPYVHMVVDDPNKMVQEADRLAALLLFKGVSLGQGEMDPLVQVSYTPTNNFIVLSMFHVDDKLLFQEIPEGNFRKEFN